MGLKQKAGDYGKTFNLLLTSPEILCLPTAIFYLPYGIEIIVPRMMWVRIYETNNKSFLKQSLKFYANNIFSHIYSYSFCLFKTYVMTQ